MLAVEPCLSNFIKELGIKVLLLSPVLEVPWETSIRSVSSDLGKRDLGKDCPGSIFVQNLLQ